MKVLFLDIDGVLNCDSTKERVDISFGGFLGIDHRLKKRYLDWLQGKDIHVVLSSSWRLDERFTEILKSERIHWESETPNLGRRGKDINQWIKDHKHPQVSKVAILDDSSDMHPVGRYLVQTSEVDGLQDRHLKRVESLLT
jgi:HAD domain in Swiss Army Knife RNA repair proteins